VKPERKDAMKDKYRIPWAFFFGCCTGLLVAIGGGQPPFICMGFVLTFLFADLYLRKW
jgi:hypothetical protein